MATCVRADREGGFTLLEVVIALLLIVTAAAGTATLFAVSLRATSAARQQTSTTALAIQKLEQLRALTWGVDDSGLPVSDLQTNLSLDPPGSGGPGLRPSPVDALDVNTDGYVDFLDGGGEWIAGGTTVPAPAVFVRRWRVESLSDDPADTLVLHVRVTTVQGAGPSSQRLPAEARVVSVMTRKAR